MNALKKLRCRECTSLTTLPAMPALEELNCGLCDALVTLGEMSSLKRLDCTRCHALTQLPDNIPVLEQFGCKECSPLAARSKIKHWQVFVAGNACPLLPLLEGVTKP